MMVASERPNLSVIIVSYNMARELPRTIRSMSPAMQRGLHPSDYELILVDNGSTQPFDADLLRGLAPNLTIHQVASPTVSPVGAIGLGLELARGELIGVCIDGARMVSPGMFSAALAASKLHAKPMIGTLAFHLGPEVQMQSVLKGYNQAVEDELLEKSSWEADGYRLFALSAFAGSSNDGWFVTPAETNALFLTAQHWRDLGGYDQRFQTPGGGLANLDIWLRVCEDRSGALIMLLGEATFHQVHGGVATNNPVSPWELFHDEYKRLRGRAFVKSNRAAVFYGGLPPETHLSLRRSVDVLLGAT
jgi:glycosyltransferase involved in cell wall biosynthesis